MSLSSPNSDNNNSNLKSNKPKPNSLSISPTPSPEISSQTNNNNSPSSQQQISSPISQTILSKSTNSNNSQIKETTEIIEHSNKQNLEHSKNIENKECLINDSFNDKNIDKLIVLINSKSGGQKGKLLGKEFAKYNSILFDMFSLNSNKNNSLLKLGKTLKKYKNKSIVIICGGDGSISWATVLIDKAIELYKVKYGIKLNFPIFLPLPIGTGNDLSRSVGWGNFEPNRKFLLDTISDIYFCTKITKRFCDIDRWSVKYRSKKGNYNKLPNKFLCYLSIGYDAKVAYNWEEERRNNREKFNSQFKNQLMYVKHGATELFKPSNPINDDIEVIIDNEIILLPEFCRSFKLININSAMNGLFLWGYGKSGKGELQDWNYPALNDGKIECMGTKGLRDMLMYKLNVNHAHRIKQASSVTIKIKPKTNKSIYLQTDGEAFPITTEVTIEVKLNDKLPVVIGYQNPRGVPQWLNACLDDVNIYRTRMSLRKRFRNKYLNNNNKLKNNELIEKKINDSNSSLFDFFWSSNNDNDNVESQNSVSITAAEQSKLKDGNVQSDQSMLGSFWNLFQVQSNVNEDNDKKCNDDNAGNDNTMNIKPKKIENIEITMKQE